MLKLAGLDGLFAAAGNLYLLLMLAGIAFALWKGKTWARKLGFAALVMALFLAPIAPDIYRGVVYRSKLAKAQALFEERCKTAGEKIHKTVENVDGIYLMKVRTTTNFGDQFKLDDPYGRDSTGNEYLLNFLKGFHHQHNEAPVPGSPPRTGYSYVEAQDPEDGKRYRYTGRFEEPWQTNKAYSQGYIRFVLDKVPATGSLPRYGVTYDDISTREEREYWIAGSSLKVVDLQTNEVIAERIGYMVDWAQGSTAGFRSPWMYAADNACPGFQWNPNFPVTRSTGGGATEQPGQTLIFVEKVLEPTK